MTLIGIQTIENDVEYEQTTASYFQDVYNDSPDLCDTEVMVTVTNTEPTGALTVRRRFLNNSGKGSYMRYLQSDSSVLVTYTLEITYRTVKADLTHDEIATYPLSTNILRDEYVAELKKFDEFKDLTAVSSISTSGDQGAKAHKSSKSKVAKTSSSQANPSPAPTPGTKSNKSNKDITKTPTGTGSKAAKAQDFSQAVPKTKTLTGSKTTKAPTFIQANSKTKSPTGSKSAKESEILVPTLEPTNNKNHSIPVMNTTADDAATDVPVRKRIRKHVQKNTNFVIASESD